VVWNVELDGAQRAAFADLAALLPYLGRADAIVDARILDPDEPLSGEINCRPVADEVTLDEPKVRGARLLVPEVPLDLEALALRPVDVRRQRALDPPGTAWQRYEVPAPEVPQRTRSVPRQEPVEAVRFALHAPAAPSRRAAVAVGNILRQASMSRYGARNDGSASLTLAGKDEDGTKLRGHRHAHYLAFSTGQNPLLEHVVVWSPAGFDERELDALETLRELRGYAWASDFRECRLGLEAVGAMQSVAPELVGPARLWRSFTPFAPARHGKHQTPWIQHAESEVRRELQYRDFPEPARVSALR